jgi:hypothetical protein
LFQKFEVILFTPPSRHHKVLSAIRDKSKQNAGSSNNNNRDQGGRNNNYSGPNRKCNLDNTVAAIQRPAKDNSKKTSGGFKDLLKEKCPWHLEGNHTTE